MVSIKKLGEAITAFYEISQSQFKYDEQCDWLILIIDLKHSDNLI